VLAEMSIVAEIESPTPSLGDLHFGVISLLRAFCVFDLKWPLFNSKAQRLKEGLGTSRSPLADPDQGGDFETAGGDHNQPGGPSHGARRSSHDVQSNPGRAAIDSEDLRWPGAFSLPGFSKISIPPCLTPDLAAG
jgi:hypothetical protein